MFDMDEEQINWKPKADHHLRALFERTINDEEALNSPVQILICVSDKSDFESLDIPELQLGSVAGNTATAIIQIKDIPRVAGSSSILFIELSGNYSPGSAVGDIEEG